MNAVVKELGDQNEEVRELIRNPGERVNKSLRNSSGSPLSNSSPQRAEHSTRRDCPPPKKIPLTYRTTVIRGGRLPSRAAQKAKISQKAGCATGACVTRTPTTYSRKCCELNSALFFGRILWLWLPDKNRQQPAPRQHQVLILPCCVFRY